MATRASAKMFADIKCYLDDAIKDLVAKSNINSLKSFIEEQFGLIKDLTGKITTLNEKLNAIEESIEKKSPKFNKITNLEGKIAFHYVSFDLK